MHLVQRGGGPEVLLFVVKDGAGHCAKEWMMASGYAAERTAFNSEI